MVRMKLYAWPYQAKYLYNKSSKRSQLKAGDIVRQDIDSKNSKNWNQYSFSPQPAVVVKDQLYNCKNVDIAWKSGCVRSVEISDYVKIGKIPKSIWSLDESIEDKLLREVKTNDGLSGKIVCRTGFRQWSGDWMVKLDTKKYLCLWEEDIMRKK